MAAKWMVEVDAAAQARLMVEMNWFDPDGLVEPAIGQFEHLIAVPPVLIVVVTTPSECQRAETE